MGKESIPRAAKANNCPAARRDGSVTRACETWAAALQNTELNGPGEVLRGIDEAVAGPIVAGVGIR